MHKKRRGWIDYARGIAIVLVLYRHVFEGLKQAGVNYQQYIMVEYANIMFYSFRMPLFFIVSGFFVSQSLRKQPVSSFVATKARTILYPYFVWGIIQIGFQLLFKNYVNTNVTESYFLYLLYSPRHLGQFWYLFALFNVAVLYALSKTVLKVPIWLNLVIGLLLFYSSSWMYVNNVNIFFVGDIFHYYLFFAIGDLAASFVKEPVFQKFLNTKKAILITVVPFFALQYIYLHLNLTHTEEHYLYVEYYMPFVFLIASLFGCVFIIYVSKWLDEHHQLNWLRVLGENSLYIYVSHVLVMAGLRIFMMQVLGISNFLVLLVAGIFCGLLVPVYLYKLAERFSMTWLFRLENPLTQQKILRGKD